MDTPNKIEDIIKKINARYPYSTDRRNYGDMLQMHYEGLMKEVSGIKDIFSIIIDITDKNNAQAKSAPTPLMSSTSSVADELQKLAKLRDAGVLSEEEFKAQKSKLLNT